MRAVVGAAVGDVDRDVAEDADAARGRVGAQRLPLALEPHLILERAAVGEPVVDPVGVSRTERVASVGVTGAPRIGEQRRRAREGRGRHVGRAGDPFGRAEGQNLPPALSRGGEPVDEAVRVLVAETPFGSEVGWSRIPEARVRFMRLRIVPTTENLTQGAPSEDTQPPRDPDPGGRAELDCGRYAGQATVGDAVDVYATIVKDGHDALAGGPGPSAPGERGWREEPLRRVRERSLGRVVRRRPAGALEFAVAAWTDRIATWQDELAARSTRARTDLARRARRRAQSLLGRRRVTVEEALAPSRGDRAR